MTNRTNIFLVTGAAGHLGSTLVDTLLQRKQTVRAFIMPNENMEIANGLTIYKGNICDKDSLREFFTPKIDCNLILIHCAGIVSISSDYIQAVYDVNVGGTKNIVDMAIEYKIAKMVHVSSVHAIKELPISETVIETEMFDKETVHGLYAQTKAEATAYVLEASQKHGLNVSVVHPSGICGPNDLGHGHITSLIIDYYRHKLTAAIKGGYDFVDVRDVANGIINCCIKGKKGECYLLTNKYYTIREILFMLHKITGKKEIKTFLPLWFVRFTAPLAELYYKIRKKPPLYTEYSIYTLQTNSKFSHIKADKELGYTTRDMKETLIDTIDFLTLKGIIQP